MKPPRRDDRRDRQDLHLSELLDFRPDQGIIRLHDQRVVILSAAAMGLLSKELIDTLGLDAARRVALRFGFADGYHDAGNLRERSTWTDAEALVRAGAVLRTLEGIVRVEVRRIAHDTASGRFEEEVVWHDSYVAEQHVHHHGTSAAPVCWSLVGYASGFASACLGDEVYCREVSCAGQGERQCRAIGPDAGSWGTELDDIRADFQAATRGTIFLDEIGEMAATLQAKLLRALQEREIRRVGAERSIKIHARVVAATNRDLRGAVEAGTFREDLYFRLAAFIITVPPLRDRRDDIPALVHHFLVRAAARMKKDVSSVSAEAMTALMTYRWPGNVRELEHAVERAVILANHPNLRLRDLPPEVTQKARGRGGDDALDLQKHERVMIEKALERFGGNRRKAADALNISTVTLWRKMKQFGISS